MRFTPEHARTRRLAVEPYLTNNCPLGILCYRSDDGVSVSHALNRARISLSQHAPFNRVESAHTIKSHPDFVPPSREQKE